MAEILLRRKRSEEYNWKKKGYDQARARTHRQKLSNAGVVLRNQTFRLTTEDLDSITAFIG